MSVTIDGSASVTINSGAILGITSGTAVASTSGTSIDFTSIPSWVKRITVMLDGVSTNGTSDVVIQIGAGSVETTSYAGLTNRSLAGGTNTVSLSTSFNIDASIGDAASVRRGLYVLTLLGSNVWVFGGSQSSIGGANAICFTNGSKTTSGTLDRVRITTAGGTNTFDAGTINILYE